MTAACGEGLEFADDAPIALVDEFLGGFFANRDPGGSAAARLYLPVSRPLASGK